MKHTNYNFSNSGFYLMIFFLMVGCWHKLPGQTSYDMSDKSFLMPQDEYSEKYDLTGWRLGINMGMFMAGKSTAQYYSGEFFNENNIEYVLNNYYWYEEIKQELNGHNVLKNASQDQYSDWQSSFADWQRQYGITPNPTDETYFWVYYPLSMKYDATISMGFYAKYNFNNSTGIFFQSNYVKLKTGGAFQLVIDSVTYFSEPALRTGYIVGTEERVNIEIGISKTYPIKDIIHFFVETGFHINSTRVLTSDIQIGKREYTIINKYGELGYQPGTAQTEYEFYQGGIGFGIFLAGGLKFQLTEDISIDPGIQFYYKKLNLEGYKNFTPDYFAYVRLIFDLFPENQ